MGGFYWIASYPKSGNTWLRLLLNSLRSDGVAPDFGTRTGFAPVAAQHADMDMFLDVEASELTPAEAAELRHDLAITMAAEIREPQFRKVHDCWDVTPSRRPLFPPEVTLGSVYLVRDPRDVAVSWAHHSGVCLDEAIDFMGSETAVIVPSGRGQGQHEQHLTSWSAHVASWLAATPTPLLVSYERLSADPAAVLAEVATHCGIGAAPDAVARAVDANRFDRLQAEERAKGFRLGQAEGRTFFRRGVAGGWRDTLSATQAERILRDHGPMMKQLGYLR